LQRQEKDPNNSFNKNKKLQKWWQGLAVKFLVLVFRDGSSEYKYLQRKSSAARRKEYANMIETANADSDVSAVLTTNGSWEAYDNLYQNAKSKSPEEVIRNWRKYFFFPEQNKLAYPK
jgi:hypothetical protein